RCQRGALSLIRSELSGYKMLSRRAKYALKAMISRAAHRGAEPLSVTDLAERTNARRSFLEQILSDLKRRNLLVSSRGKQGGFRLARAAEDISFADVIRPIDGPLALAPGPSRHTQQHIK